MHRKRCGRQRTRTRSNALRFSADTRWKHRADKQEREGKEHGEGRRSKDPHPDVLPRSTQGNLLRSSLRSGGTLRRAESFSREHEVRTSSKREKPQDRSRMQQADSSVEEQTAEGLRKPAGGTWRKVRSLSSDGDRATGRREWTPQQKTMKRRLWQPQERMFFQQEEQLRFECAGTDGVKDGGWFCRHIKVSVKIPQMNVSEEAEAKASKNPGGSCEVRRTTSSAGSATPGSGKSRRSKACARLRTPGNGQRRSDPPGRWRGTFRRNGKHCCTLFGERNRQSRDAERAGRKRRPFSQAAPGQPGLLRGGSSHENVKRGSRQGSAGLTIAGHCGPDGRGACRQMSSRVARPWKKVADSPAQAGGWGADSSRKALFIRHPARDAVSRERTLTNRRTSNPAGGRAAQAAKSSWRMVVWPLQQCGEETG